MAEKRNLFTFKDTTVKIWWLAKAGYDIGMYRLLMQFVHIDEEMVMKGSITEC